MLIAQLNTLTFASLPSLVALLRRIGSFEGALVLSATTDAQRLDLLHLRFRTILHSVQLCAHDAALRLHVLQLPCGMSSFASLS
jgi:hypothetical protein